MKTFSIIVLSICLIFASIKGYYLTKDLKKCIELTKHAQSETKQMQDLCKEMINISNEKDTIIHLLRQSLERKNAIIDKWENYSLMVQQNY